MMTEPQANNAAAGWKQRSLAAEAECRRLRSELALERCKLAQALIFIAKNNPDLIRDYEIEHGRPMQ